MTRAQALAAWAAVLILGAVALIILAGPASGVNGVTVLAVVMAVVGLALAERAAD